MSCSCRPTTITLGRRPFRVHAESCPESAGSLQREREKSANVRRADNRSRVPVLEGADEPCLVLDFS